MSLLMAALKKAEATKAQLPPSAKESRIAFTTPDECAIEALRRGQSKGWPPTADPFLISNQQDFSSSPGDDRYAIAKPWQPKLPRRALLVKYKKPLLAIGLLIVFPSTGISLWLSGQPRHGERLHQLATAGQKQASPGLAPATPPLLYTQETRTAWASSAKEEDSIHSDAALAQRVKIKQEFNGETLSTGKTKPSDARGNQAATAALNNGEIRVTTSNLRIDPALEQAYSDLQKGELMAAKSAYGAALKNDPNNVDALNGLALSHLRSGQRDTAYALFQRSLEIDPRNSFTLAALAGLKDHDGAIETESRFKTALAEQPDSPHLYFSLGNFYARQQQWGDAQHYYFQAMALAPENPDYLFNLAVSLDHLQQTKLARQYYGQALLAAEKQPAVFMPRAATERLRDLQP